MRYAAEHSEDLSLVTTQNETARYLLAVDAAGFYTVDTHDDDRPVRDTDGLIIRYTDCDWQEAAEWVAEQNGWHERQMQNLLTDAFRRNF